MVVYILSILIAVLGLGLLILIHELGHYFMARRMGMKVETFSIGFGRPIYAWRYDDVQWQIGWLPFGGYVKILGMELKEDQDPYNVPGGFFSKSPWQRMKVSFAGPAVNLVFALLVFVVIWSLGGREKNYSQLTPQIGWLDPHSELYEKGVRPGDEILSYNSESYHGVKDHMYAPMTSGDAISVEVKRIDYFAGTSQIQKLDVRTYPHPHAQDASLVTAGIIEPASFIFYAPSEVAPTMLKSSPMEKSGIKSGDRIIWIDGELVFSSEQMSMLLNDQKVLLTVERRGQKSLKRVPIVRIEELKLDGSIKEEFLDWQHEAKILDNKIDKLYVIPYNLTPDNVVEEVLRFIDPEDGRKVFPEHLYSSLDEPLQPGDKIIAISGVPVSQASKLFERLQQKQVQIIVERESSPRQALPFSSAEKEFSAELHLDDLAKIASSIGSEKTIKNAGSLYLLDLVTPKKITDFELSPEEKQKLAEGIAEQRQQIELRADPDRVHDLLSKFDRKQNLLKLGVPIQDQRVVYNPQPLEQFSEVFREIAHTLTALFSGYLNPKWISGPIGIVQVVQQSWGGSLNETLYWLGVISLNLGMLNLLPIPVLDGGYIVLFLYEMVSRRRLHPKTLEKLIIPFVVLLIAFILYVTFHDIERLLQLIN